MKRIFAPHRPLADPGTSKSAMAPTGSPVYSVAFSRDGKTLASGIIGGSVRLWNVVTPSHSLADTTNLVRYLCALAGRPLTSSSHRDDG